MITNDCLHHEGKPRPWAMGAFSDHMAAKVRNATLLLAVKVRQVHQVQCTRYSTTGVAIGFILWRGDHPPHTHVA